MGHTPLGPLAFWEGYEAQLLELGLYAVGIALYALLIGVFYQTLSKRNLVGERARRGPGAFGWLVVFPMVSFGMFMVLSVALFFLAKSLPDQIPEPQRVQQILQLSMAMVAGVRVAAYLNEQAAEDLAKLVPLGLIGVLLIDPGFLTYNTPFERLAMLPSLLGLIGRYLLALVVLEFGLRGLWFLLGKPAKARAKSREKPRAPEPASFEER